MKKTSLFKWAICLSTLLTCQLTFAESELGKAKLTMTASVASRSGIAISNDIGVLIDPSEVKEDQNIYSSETTLTAFSNETNGHYVEFTAAPEFVNKKGFVLKETTGGKNDTLTFVMECDTKADGSALKEGKWAEFGNEGRPLDVKEGMLRHNRKLRAKVLKNQVHKVSNGTYSATLFARHMSKS